MAGLERFIHDRKSALPARVKAALAHVRLETIHPFLDSKGRIGRLLIVLMLNDAGILSQLLLYPSLYFKQDQTSCHRLLNRIRKHGDWESWVDFFLKGVESVSTDAVETARSLANTSAMIPNASKACEGLRIRCCFSRPSAGSS